MTHGRSLTRAGFHALAAYRIGAWQHGRSRPLRYAVRPLYGFLYFVSRNIYGIELPPGAVIGRRLNLAHQGGVVVITGCEIGDDCSITQNVTIGIAGGANPNPQAWHRPRLGNNVRIGAGAVIAGGVQIGDGAVIGPNTVVLTDVPAGSIAVAPPTRILSPGVQETHDAQETLPASRQPLPAENALLKDLLLRVQELVGDEIEIDADTPLFTSGLLDSLSIVLLVDVLEERYGFRAAAGVEALGGPEVDTPAQMLDYMTRRRDAR